MSKSNKEKPDKNRCPGEFIDHRDIKFVGERATTRLTEKQTKAMMSQELADIRHNLYKKVGRKWQDVIEE